MNKTITLSSSSISLFLDCPRCFWLYKAKGVKRPDTPFPSLPSGMDLILKKHFDNHRLQNQLPQEMEGFSGKLYPDLEQLNIWRSQFKGLRFTETNGIVLMGALDDLFITSDGKYAPLDFKTRGFPRKENTHKYYQNQMDIYSFLLEKTSLPSAGFAILLFYHPKKVNQNHNIEFHADPVKIPTSLENAEKIFKQACECVKGEEPEPSNQCGFCNWKGSGF